MYCVGCIVWCVVCRVSGVGGGCGPSLSAEGEVDVWVWGCRSCFVCGVSASVRGCFVVVCTYFLCF